MAKCTLCYFEGQLLSYRCRVCDRERAVCQICEPDLRCLGCNSLVCMDHISACLECQETYCDTCADQHLDDCSRCQFVLCKDCLQEGQHICV